MHQMSFARAKRLSRVLGRPSNPHLSYRRGSVATVALLIAWAVCLASAVTSEAASTRASARYPSSYRAAVNRPQVDRLQVNRPQVAPKLATASAAAVNPVRYWRSGVFDGYGPLGDAQFAAWRGVTIQTATDWIGSDNWGQIENPSWSIAQWATDKAVQPDLTVALWPSTGGSLAAAATGAYNAHFVALARNLVAGGLGSASVRLGWEFNGSWYPWSVTTPADAANFASAWRQIVTAMRTVPGQNLSFDWSPTLNPGGLDPTLSYPGNAYVTDIGLDVYDWNETANASPAQRWSQLVNNGYGLAWQANFAAAHSKPIAFPEWGLVADPANPAAAGGDDTLFIQNMHSWFGAHNTTFENYFDADPGTGQDYGITTGNGLFPQATALYKKLYSTQGY
jgi:beta-mannanase